MWEIQQVKKMKIQMVIVKIFILGALFIISNQNLHLGISQEREIFLDAYTGWITDIMHTVINLTGNVVKFEWLPK